MADYKLRKGPQDQKERGRYLAKGDASEPITFYRIGEGFSDTNESLNPQIQQRNYVNGKSSSITTGFQESWPISGERYVGDYANDLLSDMADKRAIPRLFHSICRCKETLPMTSSLGQYQAAVERFIGNEQRVQDFANDNEQGFYETNREPVERVETLPHLMRRLQGRYLTIIFKGPWLPETQYSMNDVVQSPDGAFWLVVRPYTSGTDFHDDQENNNLIPYGVELGAAENNFRWPWTATENIAAGEILTLPHPYYPSRNSLILFYQGAVCAPRKDGVEISGLYQYEEIGQDPNQLTAQVRVHFPIAIGDALDMFVAASAFSDTLTELHELILSVDADIEEAKEAAQSAAQSKTEAATLVADADEALTQRINSASASSYHGSHG